MNFLIFFAAVVAVALAGPAPQAEILRYENENGIDSYSLNLETSDGIARQEQGVLKNAGTDNEVWAVTGSFKYVGPDGVTYTVTFVADENGFRPTGAHLPQPL